MAIPNTRAIAGDPYEGASRLAAGTALWTPALRSADSELVGARDLGNARARDVLRNDAYVAAGVAVHRDSIVGSQFLLNAKPHARMLGLDETWEREFQEEVEAKFTLYAESPECWLDARRVNTLTGMLRLAVVAYVYGGEVLATVEWMSRERRRPYRTALQLIEAERLCNPYASEYNVYNYKERGGIERDDFGRPLWYNIRNGHPSDGSFNSIQFRRVPARLPWGRVQVIHILEPMRIDQTRGISELVSGLKQLRYRNQYEEVVLQNAIVSATFAATIESELPQQAADVFGVDGEDPAVQAADEYINAVSGFTENTSALRINGVKIPHLYPGSKLELRPAGSNSALGNDFERSMLRHLAANLGMSYEELSRDYSKTNFSSARAAMVQTWKFMQARKKVVADRFATHAYRLWLEEAINAGALETARSVPNIYEGQNFDALSSCEWLGASRGQIDEFKETQAAAERIAKGLSTYEIELGRLGLDWRSVFAQRQREREEMEARGIAPPAPAAPAEQAGQGGPDDGTAQEEQTEEDDSAESE